MKAPPGGEGVGCEPVDGCVPEGEPVDVPRQEDVRAQRPLRGGVPAGRDEGVVPELGCCILVRSPAA